MTLWQRVRENIDRLNAIGQATSDPARVAEKLAARAKLLRHRPAAVEPESRRLFLAFHKGSQHYAIPVDEVLEVQALEHFSPVPRAPAFLPGVIHWRGGILTLLDLSKLLEIPESGLADVHVCVIVEAAGKRIAVAAGEVDAILALSAGDIRTVPEPPRNVSPDCVVGAHEDSRLIVSMDRIVQDAAMVNWRNGF